ncbi:mechanosensitive ion channel family protein [Woeseia oceani]|uniref:Mechanosensitive ion channel protein n=1 Tax=Woeseia oceani TaxID=1548547 RepID=A0A193LL22_9GAMM|nr:mechanosensitive ion channel domain-containing protein [Woeseia oceani]ANO53187.1 mechanosensitive ion channel protein [Woeseia oceani]
MQKFNNIWHFPLIPLGSDPITVGEMVLVALLIVIGYLISRLMEKLLSQRLAQTEMRPDAIQTLQRIVFYVLIVCVALTAMSLLHIPVTAFAFLTGAIAIGVGFGAQNIINNFISGWILMVERPVRIDDYIEVDEHTGVVERIGNRSTRIRRVDGVHILVPNSQMLERTVVNWTLVDQQIRAKIRVGVAYGTPTRKVAELIEQAVVAQSEVQPEPAPTVIFEDFGDSALVFDAYFWCLTGGERGLRRIRSEIRHSITELFDANGIVIAFPQVDLHLDAAKPLQIQMAQAAIPSADSED